MHPPKPRSSPATGPSSAHGRSMASGSSLTAVLLGKTALFGALERDDRVAVARQMHRAAFEPGQTIFGRGDAGSDVYLVVKGRVRLSVFSFDGRLLSFKHADAGDIFGEIAALDGGPRTADAIALTRVEAMTLAQERLNRLIECQPARRPRRHRLPLPAPARHQRAGRGDRAPSCRSSAGALPALPAETARRRRAARQRGHPRPRHVAERACLADRCEPAEGQRGAGASGRRRRHRAHARRIACNTARLAQIAAPE